MTTRTAHRMRITTSIGVLVVIILGLGLWVKAETQAAESSGRSSRASRSTSSVDGTGEDAVARKLDQVLANQETIFRRLDEVMEELRIVKIRATLN